MSTSQGSITPQGKQQQGVASTTQQPPTPMQIVGVPPPPRPVKPPNPIMGTSEETYPGSRIFYLVFGGKPKPDWSGIEDLSTRTMSDLCFRSLDPVAGQKSLHYRTKPLNTRFETKDSISDFQENVWDHLTKYGLDTIGYLPDPREPGARVLCVVTKHAQFTGDMTMVQILAAKTLSKFDKWDKKNNSEAQSFLIDSLSDTVKKGFKPFYDKTKDSFAMIWLKLIHYLVTSNSRTFDKLKDDIRKIKPQNYSGQNIEMMSTDYIEKSNELTNAGYFEVSLILNMVDGFLCASPDAKGTFHFNMNNVRSKVERLQRLTVFMSKQEQLANYAVEKVAVKDICFDAVKDYKTLCDANLWEPKKLPRDRQGPVTQTAQLAMINKQVHNLIANMPNNSTTQNNNKRSSGNSEKKGKGGKKGNGNKGGNSGNSGNCYNCGEPGHTANNCPKPRATPDERKIIRHKNLPAWRMKAPRHGDSHTKTVDSKTYYWCDKCENWTTTHNTQSHGKGFQKRSGKRSGKKNSNFSPETNLTSFEPELWLAQVDVEEKENHTFSLFNIIKYLYFVLTTALLLGLHPAFTSAMELTYSTLSMMSFNEIQEWIHQALFVLGPLFWITLGYIATKLPTMFKPTFDPVLLPREPRYKRRDSRSRSRSRPTSRSKLKSARDHNLSPKYPLKLRQQQKYNTRSSTPTVEERRVKSTLNDWTQIASPVANPYRRNSKYPPPHFISPSPKKSNKRHAVLPGQQSISSFFHPQPYKSKGGSKKQGGSNAQRKRKYKSQNCHKKHYKTTGLCSQCTHDCKCDLSYYSPPQKRSPESTFYKTARTARKQGYKQVPLKQNYVPVGLRTSRDSPNLNMTVKQNRKLKEVARSILLMGADVHAKTREIAHNVSLLAPSGFRAAVREEKAGSQFTIVWDSGASICVTPDRNDFVTYSNSSDVKTVKGVGGNASTVVGQGEVDWSVYDINGSLRTFRLPAYHIPNCKARLISTSALLNTYQGEHIIIDGNSLKLSGIPDDPERSQVVVFNSPVTHLPTTTAYASCDTDIPGNTLYNTIATVNENNHNLSEAQKELLRWHQRLGHLDFSKVKHLLRTGVLSHTEGSRHLHTAASKIEHTPKCAACLFGKQTIRTAPGKAIKVVRDRVGVSKSGNLLPGQEVSVDHFISSVRGRLFEGYNRGRIEDRYVGGCIFVDHASSYIHVEFQASLSSHETLSAKMEYEKHCRDTGVVPQKFISDNGTSFASKEFSEHLSSFYQISRFAGVGAHHHNAIAERAIRTIMSIARTMMIHAGIHWSDVADSTLWPMAVKHACFLFNHVPSHTTGLSPSDLFTKTRWPQKKFLDLHVWGCPVYVLEKSLQDGKKIPKWRPRSKRSVYLGISHKHASTVPIVLNTSTGSITPQFHVVFDDWFATVGSDHEDTPDFMSDEWNKMFGESRYQYITEDKEDNESSEDLIETLKSQFNADRISELQDKAHPAEPLDVEEPLTTSNKVIQESDSSEKPRTRNAEPVIYPKGTDATRTSSSDLESSDSSMKHSLQRKESPPQKKTPVKRKSGIERLDLGPRRSRRAGKGKTTERLTYSHDKSSLTGKPANLVLEAIDDSGIHSYYLTPDCYVLLAASKENNPDLFSYDDAMKSEQKQEWIKAAVKEIAALEKFDCWTQVPLESATTKVLPGTWVFKVKRAPDGSFKKFKARYCIRGDLQEGDFETYAPVVQFSSVRLFLAWSLMFDWYTCSVDFSNAFIQATLKDPTFIHLPRGFCGSGNQKTCLKLKKSLYGLSVAPRLWYQHLWKALKRLGLTASKHDSCLLLRKDLIVICYVDDLGIQAPNKKVVDNLIQQLRNMGFELTFEGSFSEYLGIKYSKINENEVKMTQEGLIKKIMEAAGMQDCNSNRTPTTKEALGSDENGQPMEDEWNYRSIIGMLLYLSTNTRPDISFAVSQVARFSHAPKKSHASAVKTIIRYLAGSVDQGVIYKRPDSLTLDCYVDADFAGLYGREPPESPTCVKSRTGYIISVGGCYIMCKSQLQSTIALSTSEAEYGALSQSMRAIIPVRETLLEIIETVEAVDSQMKRPFGNKDKLRSFKTVVHEDNNAALGLAVKQKVTSRTKHWCVKFHFFWSYINNTENNTSCVKVDTKEQKADYLTKGLTRDTFEHCRFLNQGW